jgi:hypothetical protein
MRVADNEDGAAANFDGVQLRVLANQLISLYIVRPLF